MTILEIEGRKVPEGVTSAASRRRARRAGRHGTSPEMGAAWLKAIRVEAGAGPEGL